MPITPLSACWSAASPESESTGCASCAAAEKANAAAARHIKNLFIGLFGLIGVCPGSIHEYGRIGDRLLVVAIGYAHVTPGFDRILRILLLVLHLTHVHLAVEIEVLPDLGLDLLRQRLGLGIAGGVGQNLGQVFAGLLRRFAVLSGIPNAAALARLAWARSSMYFWKRALAVVSTWHMQVSQASGMSESWKNAASLLLGQRKGLHLLQDVVALRLVIGDDLGVGIADQALSAGCVGAICFRAAM